MSDNPMNEKLEWFAIMTDRYMSQTLTDTEAQEMLTLFEKNNESKEQFFSNIWTHLQLVSGANRDAHLSSLSSETFIDQELSWDDLVELQNMEKPRSAGLSLSTDGRSADSSSNRSNQEQFTEVVRFLRLCFWPTKDQLKESIAPVMTALSLFVILGTLLLFIYERTHLTTVTEYQDLPITTMLRVNDTIDVVWADNAVKYQPGQLVDASRFQIQSGMIQLEMNNGTKLTMNGPADIMVSSPMTAFCHSGQVSVSVPPNAIGFEISSPFGKVIDRGTEFFLDVSKDQAQVEVVQGKVDFLSSTFDLLSLFTNEAAKLNLQDKISKIPYPSFSSFISLAMFDRKVKEKTDELLLERNAKNAINDANPYLLANLDFSEVQGGTVVNRSSLGKGQTKYARLYKTTQTIGMTKNDRSIAFHHDKSYGELTLSGEYESMTLEMNVRIDQLKNQGNVILASKSYNDSKQGSFLVQLLRKGQLQVQIVPEKGNGERIFESEMFETAGVRGIWQNYRVELDSRKKQIRFYVDNKKITTRTWNHPTLLSPGTLTLGNLLSGNKTQNSRSLGGSLGQLYIYDSTSEFKRNQVYR